MTSDFPRKAGKRGKVGIVGEGGPLHVLPQVFFQHVATGHPVLFRAFFVQDEVEDVILLKTVPKPHSDGRAHPGAGIKHHSDERPVSNPTRVDRIDRPQ